MAREIESVGGILLVSSPQNSKNLDLLENDLWDHPVYKETVQVFDRYVGRGEKGSLHPDRQLASVTHSVASHRTFKHDLVHTIAPGYLGPTSRLFKLYFTGHSIGEFGSFTEAGIMDIPVATQLLLIRENITEQLFGEGLKFMVAAVGLHVDEFQMPFKSLRDAFGNRVRAVLANKNTSTEGVISISAKSGDKEGIVSKMTDVLAEFKHPMSKGLRLVPLSIPNAFHSPYLKVEQRLFNAETEEMLNAENFRTSDREIVYSPMLRGWIRTRKQALHVVRNQLTLPVHFREGMINIAASVPNLQAIVTADILETTPKMVRRNLEGIRDIPVFNIKDQKTLNKTVNEVANILAEYQNSNLVEEV
jgi:malonyl CoA-acyl carrier protein transacylase